VGNQVGKHHGGLRDSLWTSGKGETHHRRSSTSVGCWAKEAPVSGRRNNRGWSQSRRRGALGRHSTRGPVEGARGQLVEAGTGEVIAVEDEARWCSASMRLCGSQHLATGAHTKKTMHGAPKAWRGGLPTMAHLISSGSRP
jgi:hypothetical protein